MSLTVASCFLNMSIEPCIHVLCGIKAKFGFIKALDCFITKVVYSRAFLRQICQNYAEKSSDAL